MGRSVGFLGLGVMGAAMARRLIDAGHRVAVYNRTDAKADPLVAAGARRAASPREAARGAEVVISMVTASADVEEILLGPDGAAHGAAAGAVFVDMSTTSPATARKVGAALRERGIGFLDSPVTGMDVRAREGTLSLFVGGEKADLERVRDVLSVLANRITHFGPQGAGQIVKACNQVLCAVNMVGIVEALHLARASGLDLQGLLEALIPGAGGSWALENLAPRTVRGDFSPGGRIALMQKDLRIVQEEAGRLGLALEGVATAQRYFADNEAHGESDLGTQAMFKVLERKSSPPPARRC
jgi:3-hydroxyisobutyrate dehydrogenase